MNEKKDDSLELKVIFVKASTLIDGGWRISFDLSNEDGDIVAELAKMNQQVLTLLVLK